MIRVIKISQVDRFGNIFTKNNTCVLGQFLEQEAAEKFANCIANDAGSFTLVIEESLDLKDWKTLKTLKSKWSL